MNNAGTHVLADIYLSEHVPDDVIMATCKNAIIDSGMTVVAYIAKDFEPHGLTAVWVLEESHFSLHTYPELNYISVDCYTCGDKGNPQAAIDYLLYSLPVIKAHTSKFARGEDL